ncbi:MAG: hypothetical protein ACK5LT_08815 [Lachnospirales bacterium]
MDIGPIRINNPVNNTRRPTENLYKYEKDGKRNNEDYLKDSKRKKNQKDQEKEKKDETKDEESRNSSSMFDVSI